MEIIYRFNLQLSKRNHMVVNTINQEITGGIKEIVTKNITEYP